MQCSIDDVQNSDKSRVVMLHIESTLHTFPCHVLMFTYVYRIKNECGCILEIERAKRVTSHEIIYLT